MNPVFSLEQGSDFDLVAASIQCRADRVGATVHEIVVCGYTVRVLAHSLADAKEAADAYAVEKRWITKDEEGD